MAVSIHGNNGVITTNGSAGAPSFAAPDNDTGLYFGTNLIHASTDGTERLKIKSDGKIEIPTTGKLSLGMISPAAQFTVGTANGSRVIEIQGTDGVIRGYNRNNSAWAQIDFEAASYSFDIGGTERVKFHSDGRVWINSTTGASATELLRVENDANTSDDCRISVISGDAGQSVVLFGDTQSYNQGQIVYSHVDHSMRFHANAGNERLRINSAGTLRIKRAVSTSLGNDSIFLGIGDTENGTNVNRMIGFGYVATFGTSVYPASIGYTETDNSGNTKGALTFNTRNSTGATDAPVERLRIKSDGEVLIGTTADRPIAGQRFASNQGWGGSLQLEKANPSAGNNSVPFFAITAWNGANEQYTGGISFNRSNHNTQGTHGAVTTSQQLGNIAFNGSDGTNFIQGAEIFAIPEQTFATNDGPTALVFGTVPDGTSETRPQERLRIKSDGGMRLVKTGGNANFTISRNESVGTTDQPIGVIDFASNTAHTTQARLMGKTLGTSNVGGDLVVETRANGGSLDERFRITGSGRIDILGDGGNDGFSLSNAYGQAGLFGGMYYNGSSWVRDAISGRKGAGVVAYTGGHIAILTAPENSGTTATMTEKAKFTNDGELTVSNPDQSNDASLNVYKSAGDNANKAILRVGYDESNSFRIYRTRADATYYMEAGQSGAPISIRMNNGGSIGEKARIDPEGYVHMHKNAFCKMFLNSTGQYY